MDKFVDKEWWKQDPDKKYIWHRFQKEDYLRKIDELFIHISEISKEHEREIEIFKKVMREDFNETI